VEVAAIVETNRLGKYKDFVKIIQVKAKKYKYLNKYKFNLKEFGSI
jgi:hypothetical protein